MEVAAGTRPYNKVARAQSQERTHKALLDTAEREFYAGTWQQASLEQIAASAGVTKQTLLRHFGSKEGLLEQTLRRGYHSVRDQRWATPTCDVAGAVDNLIEHYERWGERSLRIGSIESGDGFLAEVGRSARQLHYDWVDHAFASWLRNVHRKDRLRRRAALIAVCDVHTWWLLSRDLGLSRADVRATLIQTIKRILEEKK